MKHWITIEVEVDSAREGDEIAYELANHVDGAIVETGSPQAYDLLITTGFSEAFEGEEDYASVEQPVAGQEALAEVSAAIAGPSPAETRRYNAAVRRNNNRYWR